MQIPGNLATLIGSKATNGFYCGLLTGDWAYTYTKVRTLQATLLLDETTLASFGIYYSTMLYNSILAELEDILNFIKFEDTSFPKIFTMNTDITRRLKECVALTRILNDPKFSFLQNPLLGFDGQTESVYYNFGITPDIDIVGEMKDYVIKSIKNELMDIMAQMLLELIDKEYYYYRKIEKKIKEYEDAINYGKEFGANSNVITRNATKVLGSSARKTFNLLGDLAGGESMAKYLNRLDEYENCEFACDYSNTAKNLKRRTMNLLKIRPAGGLYKLNAPWMDEITQKRNRLIRRFESVRARLEQRRQEIDNPFRITETITTV